MNKLKPLRTIALLFILTSSCVQSRPIALQNEIPQVLAPIEAPSILPLFNYTVPLFGADDTRGVIRFTQKPGETMVLINIYAHDLPADHHYTLQYSVRDALNMAFDDSNWFNAGNGNSDFDIEADRTGAIIEEYKMSAADLIRSASFDIRFQLRDHSSEVVLTSEIIPVRPL